MLVGDFMTKRQDVVTCREFDPISMVVEAMVDRGISCVVVLDQNDCPKGIITKTDLVQAYQNNVNLDTQVAFIMHRTMEMVTDRTSRDDAAKVFEEHGHHHVIVVDSKDNEKFVGVVSSLDIATEVAKDGRAWPWFRGITGNLQASLAH